MAPNRRKPAIALSQVPSVKELCSRLGFGLATQAETTAFTDKTHAFRKSYKCSNGSAGFSLTDWNSASVQGELAAMAMAFLTDGNNGDRFWSDSRRWKGDDDLMYPMDKKIIADLLKQLFWKQNKYSLNNQAYIERKVTAAAQDQQREKPTSDEETIQSVSRASTATTKPLESQGSRYIGLEPSSRNVDSRWPVISLLEDERNEMLEHIESTYPPGTKSRGRDIFEVPEDDSDSTRNFSIDNNATHRPQMQTPYQTSVQSDAEKSSEGNEISATLPLAKRPRISNREQNKSFKKKKLVSPRRISNRPKATRVNPDYVSSEALQELFSASTSISSQTDKSMAFESSEQQTSVTRDSTQPSRNFSLPSSASGHQTPVRQSSDAGLTPDPMPKPRSRVNGAFWIITSPEPNYSEESWENGQIKGKSLSTVIEEISDITKRDCIEKIKIKMKTAFAQTTTTVHKDAESYWEIAKRNLEDKIKEAYAKDKTKTQQTHFQIWIEPIYEQNTALGGVDDVDNGEIDW